MTADAGTPVAVRVPAATGPRVDLFLLAGQFSAVDHATTLRRSVSYALAAEAAGFDGVWLAEHHFISYGVCPSAVALAGYVLGQTTRLEVGTAAAILSNRHPVALAEEAALLDAVSGGRFRLGVGRGGPWVDLEVFGSGLDRFTNGFAESLDLLLATLSGEATVRADGRFFRFREVPVVPRPSRSLPVWAAATSAATVDLAARRGLPLLLGMHDDDAAKAALLDRYTRTAAAAAGREPADAAHPSAHPAHASAHLAHASAHLAYVADTDSDAEEALRGSLSGWLARTGEYMRLDGQAGRRDLDAYVTHLLAIHPVGAPRRCVERLTASLAATGAKRLLLMVEGAGCPDLTLANIARLGAEVLPALKRSATGAPPPPRWADR